MRISDPRNSGGFLHRPKPSQLVAARAAAFGHSPSTRVRCRMVSRILRTMLDRSWTAQGAESPAAKDRAFDSDCVDASEDSWKVVGDLNQVVRQAARAKLEQPQEP